MAPFQGLFGRVAADQAGRAGDEDGFRSRRVHGDWSRTRKSASWDDASILPDECAAGNCAIWWRPLILEVDEGADILRRSQIQDEGWFSESSVRVGFIVYALECEERARWPSSLANHATGWDIVFGLTRS